MNRPLTFGVVMLLMSKYSLSHKKTAPHPALAVYRTLAISFPMKYLRFWLSFTLSTFIISYTQAQEKKKIYFYVDTVTINTESRLAEIKGRGEVIYTFFCKCLPNKNDLSFGYLTMSKNSTTKRPNVDYISWKGLLALINNDIENFVKKYDLYITEILPDRKFKTNKVKYMWPRGKTILVEKVNPN